MWYLNNKGGLNKLNKKKFPTKLSSNKELDTLYHLSYLIDDKVLLSNVYEYIKLRETLADVYNNKLIKNEMDRLWLQNIIIITAALIEAVIQASLTKLQNLLRTNRFSVPHINNHKNLLNKNITKTTFNDLLGFVQQYRMLKVDRTVIDKIRVLRNNIHISNLEINIKNNNKINLNYVSDSIEIFFIITESFFDYFYYRK